MATTSSRSAAAILVAILLPGALALAQSTRPGLGSIPYADALGTGVTFRTWAPNATSVGVKGQFSGWATLAMTSEGSSGYWSRDVAGAHAGQEYKYVINGSNDRRDPRARRVTNSAGNSLVHDPNGFDWGGVQAINPWQNDLVIYEMHVGSYNAEAWLPSTFDQAIEKLDHLENLGVSAVQVMPISEYAGDRSWGYNPADLFAVESSLGGPDAFKRFVKACHQRGIAVIVDVVHNHYGPSDLSLWQYDTWSQNGKGGIYFYNDSRSSTMWGETRPDYGRTEVRNFIRDQIKMYLDECRVDGFRWDSVFSMIYYNSGSSTLPDGQSLLAEINSMMGSQYPGRIRIAEDHAFDYSMNFDSQWNTVFHDDIKWQVTRQSDAERNMNWLADRLTAWPSHQRVIYSESHDTVGDLNSKYRLVREIDSSNPWSIWARKRQLLAAATVLTSPGIPMIFQGQEMNEDWTFSNNTALRWSLTNTWKGIVRAYGDMISMRRNKLGGTQGLKGTGINAHHRDNVNKVIGYIRWDAGGQADDVLVLSNFSVQKFTNNNYFVEFPSAGTWYTWYNSDSTNYSADFNGIGPTQVVASGSPPKAAVNMGMYSTLVFSKTKPPEAGTLTLVPEVPTGCVDVIIQYAPNGGPLATSTQIVAYIGVNAWTSSTNIALTNGGAGVWSTVYTIPFDTENLGFAFHNGAISNRVWDNNFGKDWESPVVGCADLPALVSANPPVPQGCIPVTITYQERSGLLMNATNVVLYLGRNNWNNIGDYPMTEASPGVWERTLTIDPDTWQLDFVFHNGASTNRIWDGNNGNDWRVYVSGCVDVLTPYVAITNPTEDISVSNEVLSYTLRGSVGTGIVGHLNWSNTFAGTGGTFPVSSSWTLGPLALNDGANLLRISGTNSSANPNAASRDHATNSTYTGLGIWISGQNGGQGWGGGWQLEGGTSAGHFLASAAFLANVSIGTNAWGLWANNGGISSAIRPLAGKLNVGDVLRVKYDNNWIDTDASTGIGLQNRFGQNLVEFLFIGGGTNYLVNDATTGRNTGIPWTDQGLQLRFELLSETHYELQVGTNVILGDVAPSSEALITRFRTWNYRAGNGDGFNVYLNDLRIDGATLESSVFSDEVTITRQPGALSDTDGDGFTTWEEEYAGTDPNDASSHLPDIGQPSGRGVMQVTIPSTVPGRWYDVYSKTNLVSGPWVRQNSAVQGSGLGVTIQFTNTGDNVFFRTGVFQ